MRLDLPESFEEEVAGRLTDHEYEVVLAWRKNDELRLGWLRPGDELFRVDIDDKDFTKGPEKPVRLFSRPFCRAGWNLPSIAPTAWARILELRSHAETAGRLELIFDTCALDQGIAHLLVSLFADTCDCVLTDVSLRELQDKKEEASLGKSLPKSGEGKANVIAARQLYLAASRLREFTGFRRPVWRELQLDDTALLLSRGAGGKKTSESDTALLRAVRRSIESHVQGLTRIFVTGDTSLGRRATVELPAGHTWVAYVRELEQGQVLSPMRWWCGPDEGRGIASPGVGNLLWELLAAADEVHLRGASGDLILRAFENPMWPEDYLRPWVSLGASQAVSTGSEATSRPAHPTSTSEPTPTSATKVSKMPSVGQPSLNDKVFPEPSSGPVVDKNLRIAWKNVFAVLGALAAAEPGAGATAPPHVAVLGTQALRDLSALIEGLELGVLEGEVWRDGAATHRLRAAWRASDVDAVAAELLRYEPLAELALSIELPGRPQKTYSAAATMGRAIGLVTNDDLPGAANPTGRHVQEVLLKQLRESPQRSLTIHELLARVFPHRLQMSSARALRAWHRMHVMGVFEPFALRRGGTSSGLERIEVLRVRPNGSFELESVDAETVEGYRDLTLPMGTP